MDRKIIIAFVLILFLLSISLLVEAKFNSDEGEYKIAGFGDSITAEWDLRPFSDRYNFSYILELMNHEIPANYEIAEYGQRWATCYYVLNNKMIPELERTEYGQNDIIILMCHAPNFDMGNSSLEKTIDSALTMEAMVIDSGAYFVFATQPAWHVDHATNYDSEEFYETLFPLLDESTPVINNNDLWKLLKLNECSDLYSDGVHMSEYGAAILSVVLKNTLCHESYISCEPGYNRKNNPNVNVFGATSSQKRMIAALLNNSSSYEALQKCGVIEKKKKGD